MNKLIIIPIVVLLLVGSSLAVVNDAYLYYSFDTEDTSGINPSDISGNGNNGVGTSVTTGASGKMNEAFYFDGTNDWVDPDMAGFDYGEASFCMWIYSQNEQYILGNDLTYKNDDVYLRNLYNGVGVYFSRQDDTTSTNYALDSSSTSSNTWYHSCAIFDSNNMKLFVNGVMVDNNTFSESSATQDYWAIGRQSSIDSGSYYSGKIDELAIYERALSSSEVNKLYGSGSGYNPYNQVVLSSIVCQSSGDTTEPYNTSDTTPTFSFTTDIDVDCRMTSTNNDYTTMGSSKDCLKTGLDHTCTLSPIDELYQESSIIYISCNDDHETIFSYNVTIPGLDSSSADRIYTGIQASSIWPDVQVYQDQQVFLRNLNNNQFVGIVDYVAVYGDQRWILNYENSSSLGLFNISPAVYVLDIVSEGIGSIPTTVSEYIDATKR